MKKTIVAFVSLVWLFIVTFGSHAQTTVKLPAKAYPVKVPHKTDAGPEWTAIGMSRKSSVSVRRQAATSSASTARRPSHLLPIPSI